MNRSQRRAATFNRAQRWDRNSGRRDHRKTYARRHEGNTMNQEIKLPAPDVHSWNDDFGLPRTVRSYSANLVRQIIKADREQRGEPAFGLMTPEAQDREASLQDTAPQPSQPAHTEAEVQELMEFAKHHALGTFSDATIEDKFRRVLGVPKP